MKYWVSLFAGVIYISLAQVFGQTGGGKFLQDVKTEIKLPPEAGKNVIKLFSTNQSLIAVTSNGVFRYRNGNWSGQPNGSDWQTAMLDKQGKVWLAAVNFIQKENSGEKLALPESSKNDTILCLFWEDEKTLHVGTNAGLHTWNGNWSVHLEIKARVNAIEKDASGNLWVATTNGLIVQGSQLGQVIGPPLLAWTVSATGTWQAAPWLLVTSAFLGTALSLVLAVLEKKRHG